MNQFRNFSVSQNLVWFIGGAALTIAAWGSAEIASQAVKEPEGPQCELKKSANDALNNQVKMVAFTAVDPSKYFSTSSPSSCLGDIALANVDLSGIGTAALSRLRDMLLNKVCTAARSAVGEMVGTYNSAINMVNNAPQNVLDAQIGNVSRDILNSKAMNWNTDLRTRDSLKPLSEMGGGAVGYGANTSAGPNGTKVNDIFNQSQQQSSGAPAAAQPSEKPAQSVGGSIFN